MQAPIPEAAVLEPVPAVPSAPILPAEPVRPAAVSGEVWSATTRIHADPTERVVPLAPPKRVSSSSLPMSVSLPPPPQPLHRAADEPIEVQQRRLHIAAGVVAGVLVLAVILRACGGGGRAPATAAIAPSDAREARTDAIAMAAPVPADAASPRPRGDAGSATAAVAPEDPAGAALLRASDRVAAGDVDGALRVLADAHKQFVANPEIPYMAGRLQLGKGRFAEGLASLRAAIRLFPSYADDPDLATVAVAAFLSTPSRHADLAQFIDSDLGHAAIPALEDARDHAATSGARARAATELKRLH